MPFDIFQRSAIEQQKNAWNSWDVEFSSKNVCKKVKQEKVPTIHYFNYILETKKKQYWSLDLKVRLP